MFFSEKVSPAQRAPAADGGDVVTVTSSRLIPASKSRGPVAEASYADRTTFYSSALGVLKRLNVYTRLHGSV